MKPKTEICGLCKMKIFLYKDNYIRLTDFKEGKFFMEGFYHSKCYNDQIKGGKEMKAMKRMAIGLFGRTNKMLDDAGYKGEKVYEIK